MEPHLRFPVGWPRARSQFHPNYDDPCGRPCMGPAVSCFSAATILCPVSFEIHFNIVVPSVCMSGKWRLSALVICFAFCVLVCLASRANSNNNNNNNNINNTPRCRVLLEQLTGLQLVSSWNGPTVHVCCFMLARASTRTFVNRIHIR